jgi:hypothetical protein
MTQRTEKGTVFLHLLLCVCSSPRFDPAAANFVNSAQKVCFSDMLPFLRCSRRCLVLAFTTARRTTASGEEGTETRRRLEGQREDGGTHQQHQHRFDSIGSALLTRAGEMENHLDLERPLSPDRGRPPWPRRSAVTAPAGTRRAGRIKRRSCRRLPGRHRGGDARSTPPPTLPTMTHRRK